MAKRTDGNQAEIVRALRSAGATVQTLHTVGKGCPDLVVGFRGSNYLLEIKDFRKPPSARKLTEDETRWHAIWNGQVAIVKDIDEALALIGAVRTSQSGSVN
jgi:hypothetical protein